MARDITILRKSLGKGQYWGRHYCPRRYFCGAVSIADEEMIKKYIAAS